MRYYLLILSFSILLFLYFPHRRSHPLSTYSKLTKLQAFYANTTNSPCKFHIIGGIPNATLPDGNIRINFFCSDGQESHNYFRLGAVKENSLQNILTVISQINNFTFTSTSQIKVNGEVSTIDRQIKINDTIDVYIN